MPVGGAEQKLESAGDLQQQHCQSARHLLEGCVVTAGAEKEAADLRQKLEDRSAKLAKASQDLQALAQRAEVQTTACEHKVRGRCAVASSCSWAPTLWVKAQAPCLQAQGLGSCKLERKVQLADAEAVYEAPINACKHRVWAQQASKMVASCRRRAAHRGPYRGPQAQ